MLRHRAVQRNQPPGFFPGSYVNYRCPPAKRSIAIYIKHFLSGYAVKAVLSGFAVKRVGLVKVPYANVVFNKNISKILTFCDHIYRETDYRGHSLSLTQRSRLQRPPSIVKKNRIRLLKSSIYQSAPFFLESMSNCKRPIYHSTV